MTMAQARQQVAKFTDKLGRSIDPGIFDVVVALQLRGIHTFSSCEGHVGRQTGGPYVMFRVPESVKPEEAYTRIGGRLNLNYKQPFRQAVELNMQEVQKVLNFFSRIL